MFDLLRLNERVDDEVDDVTAIISEAVDVTDLLGKQARKRRGRAGGGYFCTPLKILSTINPTFPLENINKV